jgi:hypothetical protein
MLHDADDHIAAQLQQVLLQQVKQLGFAQPWLTGYKGESAVHYDVVDAKEKGVGPWCTPQRIHRDMA